MLALPVLLLIAWFVKPVLPNVKDAKMDTLTMLTVQPVQYALPLLLIATDVLVLLNVLSVVVRMTKLPQLIIILVLVLQDLVFNV
jgi:hypothetical protein